MRLLKLGLLYLLLVAYSKVFKVWGIFTDSD